MGHGASQKDYSSFNLVTKFFQEISGHFILLITYLSWLFWDIWLSKGFSNFLLSHKTILKVFVFLSYLGAFDIFPELLWLLWYIFFSESMFRLVFPSLAAMVTCPSWTPILLRDCLEGMTLRFMQRCEVILLRSICCSLLAPKMEASLLLEKRSNICFLGRLHIKRSFKQKSNEQMKIK